MDRDQTTMETESGETAVGRQDQTATQTPHHNDDDPRPKEAQERTASGPDTTGPIEDDLPRPATSSDPKDTRTGTHLAAAMGHEPERTHEAEAVVGPSEMARASKPPQEVTTTTTLEASAKETSQTPAGAGHLATTEAEETREKPLDQAAAIAQGEPDPTTGEHATPARPDRPDTPDAANLSSDGGRKKPNVTAPTVLAPKKFSSTSINRQFQAAHAPVAPSTTISRTVLGTKMPIAGSSGSAKLVTRVRTTAPILGTVVRPVAGVSGVARPVNGAPIEGPWRPIAPRPPSPKLPSLSKEEEIRLEAMRGHHPQGMVGWDEDEDEESFAPEYVEFADGTKYEIAKEVPIQQQLEIIEQDHENQVAATREQQNLVSSHDTRSLETELKPPRPPKPDPFSPARKTKPLEATSGDEKAKEPLEPPSLKPAPSTNASHTVLTRPRSNPFAPAPMPAGDGQSLASKRVSDAPSSSQAKPVWAPVPSVSEHPLPDLPLQQPRQSGQPARTTTPPLDLPSAPMQRLQDDLQALHLQDPVPEPEAVEIAADAFVPRSPPRPAPRSIVTHSDMGPPDPLPQSTTASTQAAGAPALWVDKDRDVPPSRAPKIDRFRSQSFSRSTPNGVNPSQGHPHQIARPNRPPPPSAADASHRPHQGQARTLSSRSATTADAPAPSEPSGKEGTTQMHPAAKSVIDALRQAAQGRRTVPNAPEAAMEKPKPDSKTRAPRADPFRAPTVDKKVSETAPVAATVKSEPKEEKGGRESENWRQNAAAPKSNGIKIRGVAAALAHEAKAGEPAPAVVTGSGGERKTAAEWDRLLANHGLTLVTDPTSKPVTSEGPVGQEAAALVGGKKTVTGGAVSTQRLDRAMDTVKNAMQKSVQIEAKPVAVVEVSHVTEPRLVASINEALARPEVNASRSIHVQATPNPSLPSPQPAAVPLPQARPIPRWKVNLPKMDPVGDGPMAKRSPWDRMKPAFEPETTSYDDPIPKEWFSGIMEVALPAARFYKEPVPVSDVRF